MKDNPTRRAFVSNDTALTISRLYLRRIAPGVYEHDNRRTNTRWIVCTREVPGRPSWTFVNAESREGGNDVYATKTEAAEALVHYLRGRYFDDRFGWCTR